MNEWSYLAKELDAVQEKISRDVLDLFSQHYNREKEEWFSSAHGLSDSSDYNRGDYQRIAFRKKGDVSSTYTAELVGNDNTTLDMLPERPEILGSYILPKVDYNDMLKYVATNMSTPQDIVPRTVTNNMNNNSYQAPIKPTGIPF